MESVYPNQVITLFDGALKVLPKSHPERGFAFEAMFILDHPSFAKFRSAKPPLHMHHQAEYIQVLEGALVVEVEGKEHVLRPGDGELAVAPWAIHRLYTLPAPAPGEPVSEDFNIVRFVASAERTLEVFQMDLVFFENWYKYQDEVIRNKKQIDIIQAMCTFDAGGSYMTLPWWVPFRKASSQILGIIVGRWIAGMLGYQPFYRKWSTDWALADAKMRSSVFYRRFADSKKAA
ncbi:hypothetical protein KVR01_010252 [Diaporthe batatas]|uniref:uncharacterized protein n=1 Tax=Diaporthe batatas TaxID=748121 RepID=UPI001D042A8F|nr:uncharacterized protein KVR01_010252 [Diaporthe batatas]KAG8159615.1 hypothetical protein KVR01_010252 [Diaporthe batatas]